MKNLLRIGIDIGSTTIKMVVIDSSDTIIYRTYRRHLADIRNAFKKCLEDAKEYIAEHPLTFSIAGSGGMSLANDTEIDFIQ